MILNKFRLLLPFMIAITFACKKSSNNTTTTTPSSPSTSTTEDAVVIEVDPTHFLTAGLTESITKVSQKLADGSTVMCYKIISNNTPSDHTQGPWCPTNINDGIDKGGIWFEGGKLYDVDGLFIKNLATFYSNTTWKLYNATTGVINVTDTKAACEAAARPNVDPLYKNYCVQCLPSYFPGIKKIYYIPVKPVKSNNTIPILGMGGVVGIAFNGINFDPPAPTQAILGAYTLAPFDDAGGHVNGATGYHYHATTGKSTKIKQSDAHAAMIGYAMDGYGLFENLDESGKESTGLDASRGHYDSKRGYHYHVANAGSNSFINSFRGVPGSFSVTL
jgi:YHYH protein